MQEYLKNPTTASRQLADMVSFERNPRLNDLTAAEVKRSESFIYPSRPIAAPSGGPPAGGGGKAGGLAAEGASKVKALSESERLLKRATAEALSRATGAAVSVVDVLADEERRNAKRDGGGQSGAFRSVFKGAASFALDPEEEPSIRVYDTSLQVKPPSFGHRPGSASRTFNPVTMGVRKDAAVAPKRKGARKAAASSGSSLGAHSTGVLSTSMLRNLLRQPPSYAADQYDVDDGQDFNSSSFDAPISSNSSYASGPPQPPASPPLLPFEYVTPPLRTKSQWDESFGVIPFDITNTRPLLTLGRSSLRDLPPAERVDRFRRLAAGRASFPGGGIAGRDTEEFKISWREELDRKIGSKKGAGGHGARAQSPRSALVNAEIRQILQLDEARKLKQEVKIMRWKEVEEMQRTEEIVNRRRRGRVRADFE